MLTRLDDGTYVMGSTPIRHGDSVTGSNGHQYRLFQAGDEWFSAPIVASISILLPNHRGSITVSRFEDGTYSFSGTAVSTGDTVTVGEVNYVLELDGFQGSASATDVAPAPEVSRVRPVDAAGNTFDRLRTYIGTRPHLTDSEGGVLQAGSFLGVGSRTYSLDHLFTEGSVTEERTFVDNARSDITRHLARIEILLGLYEPAAAGGIDDEIESIWDQIGERIDQLFPDAGGNFLRDDTPKRLNGTAIDGPEVLQDLNDALAALDGVQEFEDALDDGIFSDASVDQDRLDEVFSDSESSERLGFGWTSNTRFGAYSRRTRLEGEESLTVLSGDEGLGAFAYSPLARTATLQLPASGTASYRGETVAASSLAGHGIFQGPIEIDVDFRSRQVSGRVLYLQDGNGAPWIYGGDELESILLPDSRVSASDGSFSSATGAVAVAELIPFAGGLSTVELSSDVRGRFLGSDSDGGQATIGTWEIASDEGPLLTGAFGAERHSTDASSPPPAAPSDGPPLTSFIAKPDGNGAIEIAALDSDGDRIEVSAAALQLNGGTVLSGDRFFSVAEGLIRQQLEVLELFVELQDTSTSLRELLWDNANTALQENVFGAGSDAPLGSDYPSDGSIRERDRSALSILEDVLTALSAPSEFGDSVAEGGIFEGLLGSESELADLDFFAIYDASEYDVEVQFGQTEFTRFGAWARSTLGYAASPTRESLAPDETSDVFAYSPIAQAGYRPGDPNFPADFTSTYSGQTRAVDRGSTNPQFYFGDVVVTVQWGGTPEASTVSAAILDLADSAERPFEYRGAEVAEIVFSGLSTEVDLASGLEITGSPAVVISHEDSTLGTTGFSGPRSLAGKFIGKQIDGPLGVIGTWELGEIKGAYGAELVP